MAWDKADSGLIKLVEAALADCNCDRKFIFGSPTFLINNNMFAGVHQCMVILRLSEADRDEVTARYPQAKLFEPMAGRPMKEYIALPEELCKDKAVFREWLGRAYKYTASLPPKETKRHRKKKQEG